MLEYNPNKVAKVRANITITPDPRRALFVAERSRADFVGNKRTSRFMCNGLLMGAGYPSMMITKQEQLAYNQVMTEFYNTQDETNALIWFYERYQERIKKLGFV